MAEKPSSVRIWYCEPWFWFVISPLLVVIVASLTTAGIAIYFADDAVSDNYYMEGRMLSQEFTSEEYAKSIGLSGELRFDFISGEIILNLNQVVAASSLNLLVSHPMKSDLDLRKELRHTAAGKYRSDIGEVLAGRWYLRLTAEENDKEMWRLHGEVNFSDSSRVGLE